MEQDLLQDELQTNPHLRARIIFLEMYNEKSFIEAHNRKLWNHNGPIEVKLENEGKTN